MGDAMLSITNLTAVSRTIGSINGPVTIAGSATVSAEVYLRDAAWLEASGIFAITGTYTEDPGSPSNGSGSGGASTEEIAEAVVTTLAAKSTALEARNVAVAARDDVVVGLAGKADVTVLGGEPTFVAGDIAKPAVFEGRRSPLQWGIRAARTAAQNDIAHKQCFEWCRDHDQPIEIPSGTWATDEGLIVYTGMECNGEFLCTNNAQTKPVILFESLPADKIVLANTSIDPVTGDPITAAVSWIDGSTVFQTRGQTRHAEMIPYYGYTVSFLTGAQYFIDRSPPDGEISYRTSYVVYETDGSFYPEVTIPKNTSPSPLPNWSTSLRAVARRNGPTAVVYNLRVRSESVGSGLRYSLAECRRPNVTFEGGSLRNDAVQPLLFLFSAVGASGLLLKGMAVEGAGSASQQYGYNLDHTVGATLIGCKALNCRRSVDGHGAKDTRILACDLPDGVGGHWVEGMYIGARTLLKSNPSNSAPVWVAGRDVTVDDCHIIVSSDQFAVLGVRTDMFELRGRLQVTNNDIHYDVTANQSTSRKVAEMSSNVGTHDWGRVVYGPDHIDVSGNNIEMHGSGYSGGLRLLNLFDGNTEPPSGISAGGNIYIARNPIKADVAIVPAVVINKRDSWIDGGYRVHIEQQGSLQYYSVMKDTHTLPSTVRQDVTIEGVGALTWRANYGTFRTAYLDSQTLTAARPVFAGANTTAVGDERETLFTAGDFSNVSLRRSASKFAMLEGAGATTSLNRVLTDLASYKSASGTATGAIVISLPNPIAAVAGMMMLVEIQAFLHNAGNVKIDLHSYFTTGVFSASSYESYGTVKPAVQVGTLTATGQPVIILGAVSTVWPFVHAAVTKALLSYSSATDTNAAGWSIGLVTDLAPYTIGTDPTDRSVIGARRAGWTTAATGTATRTTFDTATVTLPQLAERVKALTDDLRGHGLIGV